MAKKSEKQVRETIGLIFKDKLDRAERNEVYIKLQSRRKKLLGKRNTTKSWDRAQRAAFQRLRISEEFSLVSLPEEQNSLSKLFQPVSLVDKKGNRWPIADSFFTVREPLAGRRGPSPKRKTKIEEVLQNGRLLQMAVDVSFPLDILNLLVRDALRKLKENFKEVLPSIGSLRKHLNKNKDAYKVWDLRKAGFDFKKIGIQVYPQLPPRKSAERARKAYQRAHLLIVGKILAKDLKTEISADLATIHCPRCRGGECQDLKMAKICPYIEKFLNQDCRSLKEKLL